MGIIGTIRKHSWVAVAIVGIAIVAFIIGDLDKRDRKQKAFAKIDGEEVTYEYFNAQVEQKLVEYQMKDNSYAFKDNVWQEILQERLMNKEMNILGIRVSDAEVSDMFVGRFIDQNLQQQFTDPTTGQYNRMAVSNYSSQIDALPDTSEYKIQWLKFQESMRQNRQRNKYVALVFNGIYMPAAISNKLVDINSKSSDLRVVAMRYAQNAEMEVNITDEDYQKYFNAHRRELNLAVFNLDVEERRDLVYAVFTAQPSQNDMTEIQNEVDSWWQQFQDMDEEKLIDFVNLHGYYDSTFVSSDVFPAPLDTIIKGSNSGFMIKPQIINTSITFTKERYAYGAYVMGKVLKTEMRPDSVRASVIFIPNKNYPTNGTPLTRTVAEAKHLRDSAMTLIKGGMPFEQAVVQFSMDTTNGGDLDWRPDGTLIFGNEIVEHNVGDVFNVDIPDNRGHYIVKVTGKTAPKMKYRVALVERVITPSNDTEREVRDQANLFASQYSTCQAMIDGARSSNIQMRNVRVTAMSDSLTGYGNTRAAIRWAFNDNTVKGAVSGEVYPSDYSYIVVALQDILVPNELTLDQARPYMENYVRIEKMGEMLVEKAKNAMAGGKDINSVATALNAKVDTISAVSYFSYLGGNGLEPKAMGAIAAHNGTGMLDPVQGASGVYVICIDANGKNENADSGIRNRIEQSAQRSINYLIPILRDKVKVVDNRLLYL